MDLAEIAVLLGANLALILAVMLALWGLSLRLKDVGFVDAAWPLGMLLLALATLPRADGDPTRTWLLIWLCGVWALRLGWRRLRRWRADEDSARYNERIEARRRERGWPFARSALLYVFLPQAVLLWLTCLPVQLGQVDYMPPVGWLAWSGAVLAVLGVAFESVADAQLKSFRREPADPAAVMERGLWRYTRHPDYFGDACVWWGLYLIAAETGPGRWAVVGPLFLSFALSRWAAADLNGEAGDAARPGYAAYAARTSPFIPWPPRTPRG